VCYPGTGAVAPKRSPILGYNHNVRYRGVIFHVQTEDSGITNPHVFTHLFHGGVILSTRKLVYDAESAEDVVRSLMQAQHKAALKDLKNGLFDDKIDLLLAGIPGLLPRGANDDSAPITVIDEGKTERSGPPAAALADTAEGRAPTERSTPESVAAVAAKANARPGGVDGRATQPRVSGGALPPIPPRAGTAGPTAKGTGGQAPRQSMTPPSVTTTAAEARRDVSDAFQNILLAERDLTDALEEIAQVHSPAPASAAMPPGAAPERPGSYAQHRKRDSIAAPVREAAPAATPQRPSAPPPPPPAAARPAGATAPTEPQRPRTPTPSGPARVTAARTVTPAPAGRGAAAPPTRTHVPTPPPATRPVLPQAAQPRPHSPSSAPGQRPRSATGGNVVMSRPAVIIGAPPKVVGGAPPAPSATPPRGMSQRIRKAREDSEAGVFGHDLISEKSLDEVILAYLSEDSTEE